MAIDPQLYLDIAANNVDPMVFEFDDLGDGPGPMFGGMGVKITGTYGGAPVDVCRGPCIRYTPMKTAEEIEAEQQAEYEAEQARIKLEYETWTNKFKANHYTTELSFIFGNLNKQQLKWIKHILDTDEDATYIYAGNKDRSEFLSINDVCAHVTKSKIKNGKLVCEIEFDYTDPGLKLFRNWQNGFAPKLNLNTIFVYDEKDPNLQNLKFLCLEFV
jgi:hypothetical protein